MKVATFSNCEEVELLLNGQTQGRRRPDEAPNRILTWALPWKPGSLTARGYIGGKQVAEHLLKTAGAPEHLEVIADRPGLQANGQDLCHVEVRVVDKEGMVVPAATNQIGFDINGPARLIGVDNGDLTSNESYVSHSRHAFWGRCLAVIRAGNREGESKLLVTAEGLPSQEIAITCRKP